MEENYNNRNELQRVFIFINTEGLISIDALLHFLDVYLNCKFEQKIEIILKRIEINAKIDDIIYNGLSIFNNYNIKSPNDWILYYGSGNLPSCDSVDVFLFNDNIQIKKCIYVINKTHSDISYENNKNTMLNNMKRLRSNLDYMFNNKYYLNYHKLSQIIL